LKVKWFITIAVAAFLASAIVACSSLKGGEESKPAPAPTPTPTPEVEEGKVTKTVAGNTTTFAGKLRGTHDSNKFDVFTESDKLEVKFGYPSGAAFFVKVLGKTGDELGEFDLSEGEIIDLSGGGKFTLIIHSQNGGGPWSATYTE
jgi:hypothetical protein